MAKQGMYKLEVSYICSKISINAYTWDPNVFPRLRLPLPAITFSLTLLLSLLGLLLRP